MPQIIIKFLLEYIWIPVVLPLIVIFLKSVLRVKELKKGTDPEIEEFINLYNLRIKENLRICAEEILQFIERREGEAIEHHLYVCKKLSKTVGFIKFMYSEQHKYVFIAYAAIDKKDSVARQYAFKLMLKKIYKKYLKKKKATMILTEIERGANGKYKTGLAKMISRYTKKIKKQSYIIKFDYLQPSMPDDEYYEYTVYDSDDVDGRMGTNKVGRTVRLQPHDVLHIPGLGFDGLVGYSPIAMAKNAIGLAIATEEYGSKFFANGAAPSGVLEHPGTIKDPSKVRESWQATFGGSGNANKIAVLEEGMKYTPISISPEQAQFPMSLR